MKSPANKIISLGHICSTHKDDIIFISQAYETKMTCQNEIKVEYFRLKLIWFSQNIQYLQYWFIRSLLIMLEM